MIRKNIIIVCIFFFSNLKVAKAAEVHLSEIGIIDRLPNAAIRLSHQSVQGQFQAMNQYLGYTAKQHVPGIKESGTGYYYDSKTRELQSRTFFKILRGHPVETKNSFDFKVEGTGFFVVEMPGGSLGYTHDGRFEIDDQKRLVMRSTGFPVLGENGYLFVESSSISVNKQGQIFENENMIGAFKINWFKDLNTLDTLDRVVFFLKRKDFIAEKVYKKPVYEILQGFVEQSSVGIAYAGRVEEWTSGHQANTKMIKSLMRNLSSSIQAGAPLE